MNTPFCKAAVVAAAFTAIQAGIAGAASAAMMEPVSERTLSGFAFPESVACDRERRALYVSQFGSELKPMQKDGQGRISKLSLDGTVLEENFLPGPGKELNKPKGIWVAGNRLWVTDIDSVWEFDLDSRKGHKVSLPGIQFANDPTVIGDTLYVSDNRGDALYSVRPADFLGMMGEPTVSQVFSGAEVNPNGLYPAAGGGLLMAGFKSDQEARGIFMLAPGHEPAPLTQGIGRLDGIYQMPDGSLLFTDWDSGSLMSWNAKDGASTVAGGFTGPADFCVMETPPMPHGAAMMEGEKTMAGEEMAKDEAMMADEEMAKDEEMMADEKMMMAEGGMTVVVPDLVKSELRIITLPK